MSLVASADHRSRREGRPSQEAPPAAWGRPLDPEVAALVYELLDAHDDTVRIAADLTTEETWQAHLDYLRSLQRKGREVLAQTYREES